MKRRRVASAALLVLLFPIVLTVVDIDDRQPIPEAQARTNPSSGPCRPCETWGQVKTCYTGTPAPCCTCNK